ncbi:MAG: ABC transporter substrate-binding protein [Pseudomonadota bacterium]
MKKEKKGVEGKGISRRDFMKTTAAVGMATAMGSIGFPAVLRGAELKEILIGHIYPLSGFLAFDGQEMKKATEFGVQQVNAAGGIKSLGGAKLKLLDGDSEGKPEKAISEVERLERAGVVAITGCYQSAVTIVATQMAERQKVPFVISVASAEEITKRGFKYTFRIQPTSSMFADQALKYMTDIAKAKGQKVKTIAYLHESTQFGTALADFTVEYAPKYGLELILRVPYSTKAADLSTEVGKIKAAGADLIFDSGYFGDGVRVLRTMRDLRVNAKAIVGIANGAFSHPKFIQELGSLTEHVMDSNYQINPRSEFANKTLAEFKSKFGTDMSPSMAYGYQPIPVIADALERAKSAKREDLREALTKTNFTHHILPQGPIVFGPDGQNKNANTLLMQILKGNIEEVWPEEYSTAKVVFPVP